MSVAQVQLPEAVDRVLADLVKVMQSSLGPDLQSIVLYGSAAEGRLRPTSDVNAIIVLAAFDPAKIDALREPLRTAQAAVQLSTMVLLESEIAAAVDAFAVKFADVLHRRRVLFGTDPFAGVTLSRSAEISRLKQVLLNLTLRLRQRYLVRSLRDEQAAGVVADTAGPVRACAATLLELQGKPAAAPKEALEQVVAGLPGAGWSDVLHHVSQARETRTLPPGVAGPTILRLIDLTHQMRLQAETLR